MTPEEYLARQNADANEQNAKRAAFLVSQPLAKSPDETASAFKLASALNLPGAVVDVNYKSFAQRVMEQRNATVLGSSPKLSGFMLEGENYRVAADDIDNLSWFEGFGRGTKATGDRSLERVGQMYNQYMFNQTAGRAQDRKMSFGEILDSERQVITTSKGDERLWPTIGEFLSASSRWIDAKYADAIGTDDEAAAREYGAALAGNIERFKALPKSKIARDAEQAMFKDGATVGHALQNVGATILSNPVGVLSWALETAGESAPQLAAGLGAGLATRNPSVGVAVTTGGSYATERFTSPADFLAEKGIDLGKPEDVNRVLSDPTMLKEANERGVIRGLVISAFDAVSLGVAGKAFARNPLVEALAQGVQQAISGSLGEYTARVAAGQEIDWNEIIAEGLAEVATAPVDMGTAGRSMIMDRRRAKMADGTMKQAGEISGMAAASKLRERMPEKFREFVERATANGPVENVYIPAETFVQYFQGMNVDPFELIGDFEGVSADDLRAALASGGDLVIPTATYAAKIAGSDADPFFMENMTFDPDGMTATQAAEFNERADAIMQEAWQAAEDARVQAEELRSMEEQIYDSVVSRLRVAGQSTDVSTAAARLYPAFYRAMAERSGMSTGEFLGLYRLPEIAGSLPQGMQLRNVDELNRTLAEARTRKATKESRTSLLEFISDYGGINDVGGELRARDAETIKRGKGKKTLKLARGGVMNGVRDMFGGGTGRKYSPDEVARAAIENGFLANDPIVNEYRTAMMEGREVPDISAALWDAIDRELRGQPEYAADQNAEADAQANAQFDEMEAYLSSLGVTLESSDAEIRQALEGARQYAQPAYHGTPHLFEKFSTDRIGTGEGNQSFGWGLYFASMKQVADWYRNNLTRNGREFRYNGKNVSEIKRGDVPDDAWRGLSMLVGAKSVSDAIEVAEGAAARETGRMKDHYEAAAKWLKSATIEEIGIGRTYEVEIPDDADLMNFDILLSEQPEKIQEAFRSLGVTDMNMSGGEAYTRLSSSMGKTVRVKSSPFGWGVAGDLFSTKAKVPDQKAASLALARAGVPGHRYVGTESQSTNYVIYDDSRVSVRSYAQDQRGVIQFPAGGVGTGETVIRLFENANLSTFLHESGHYFLTVMQDMAKMPGPIADDYAVVKSWWTENAKQVAADARRAMPDVAVTEADVIRAIETGSTGDVMLDGAIDVGMQEQFARGFEAYLMEGKAPSADLRGVFEKFRAWLISVYQKLAGLNVSISDDLRRVFDRMIATDEEIKNAQADAGGNAPLFTSDEAMGLTPEDYAAFLKTRQQAEDDAKAQLLRETMAPIKREREKWFKDERAKTREEVERNINALPYFRAIEWMGNRRWLGENQPEAMPDFRMSKSILVERYGDGVLKTLPRGLQTVYAVDGGVDPDDAAGWFGFASGDEMIRAMEKAPKRVEAIDAETDRVMRERHGDALNDGSVEAEALDAVHNDKRGQWLAAELKAVVEISGQGVGLTAKDARAGARQTIARMKVRDAMASQRFLAAERKAAEEAGRLGAMLAREGVWMQNARRRIATKARAAVRGEGTVDAVPAQVEQANASTGNYNETVTKLIDAKRRQLVNHALYMEARKVADEVEAAERFVAKLNKASTRERIAGAGRRENAQVDYLAAIDEILTKYDFSRMTGRAERRRDALNAFVAAMKAEGRENEIAIPDAVMADADRKPYKTVPVEELRGVIASLKNLEHIAGRWNKLISAQRERDFQEEKAKMVQAVADNLKTKPQMWVKQDGVVASARDGLNGYLASFQTATAIIRQMDGREDIGPVYEALKSDIDDAAYTERAMRKEAAQKIEELYSVYSQYEQRQMGVRRVYNELRGRSFSKWNLIAMALNMGNEGNLDRLTNTKAKEHLTPVEVEAVKALLDERDWKFVQSVWDYLNSFRPLMAERQRRVVGNEPAWVEPTPVVTPHGTFKGGYYPIKYAGHLGGGRLQMGDTDAEILQSMMKGGYVGAATKDGHLQERKSNVNQSLNLDVSIIGQHASEVIHDLAFSEAVVNSFRLLSSDEVRTSMINAGLDRQHEMLRLWVIDAASGQVAADAAMGRIFQKVRAGFSYSKLAWNVKTMIMQPLGVFQSAVAVGKANMAQQMVRYVANPKAMSEDVFARSRMMWERRETFNKDLMDVVAKSNIASPSRGKVRDAFEDYVIPAGMAGIQYVQLYTVDIPTWAAAFQKGMKQFAGDQDKAAQYADMTVNRTQGSGIWSDRSGIERGTLSLRTRQSPFVMLFTTLGSYFFAKMNMIIERTQGLRAEPITFTKAMDYAMDMMLLLAAESAVMTLAGMAMSDGDDEEDNPAGTIGLEAFKTFIAGLPVARDIAGMAGGFSPGTYASILGTVWEPMRQIYQGEADAAAVKSIVNLAGMLFRLSSTAANRAIDAGWRAVEGEDVPIHEYLLGRSRK